MFCHDIVTSRDHWPTNIITIPGHYSCIRRALLQDRNSEHLNALIIVIIINTRHEHYPETRKIIPRTLSQDTKQCSKTLNIIPRHRTLYQDTVHYPETPNIIPRHRTLSRADYPLPGDSCGCVSTSCPRHPPLNQIMGISGHQV